MIRAMIVEDDPMVAEINKRYLKKDSRIHSIEVCSNGKSALAFLETHQVDLILLDVYMPQLNGFELLKKLREQAVDADIIMVTAANNHDDLERAIRFGVLDYLIKPFEYERFRLAIDRFFLKHDMLKDNTNALSQQDTDQLFLASAAAMQNASAQSLEKGIQPSTLQLIHDFLQEHRGENYSGGEIAREIGLSRVTVQKYLNYMQKEGQLHSEIDYKTEGRPRTCYSIR